MDSEKHPAEGGVDLDALSMTNPSVPDGACVNFEKCGNMVPGNGQMCGKCTDEARYGG